jgi:hypothetical protein
VAARQILLVPEVMMRWMLLTGMLTACGSPAVGQKVRALLIDDTVTCEPTADGSLHVANLTLEVADDIFLAEVVETATGDRITVPSRRSGTQVTFTCPEGLSTLTVRRVSVLASPVDEDFTEAGAPP